MISSPIPTSIEIGTITLYPYGLVIGISVAIIIIYLQNKLPNRFREIDYLIVLFATLFGARLLFILHNLDQASREFLYIFKVWDGGLALYGGLVGAAISIFLIARHRKVGYLDVTDAIVFILPVAQAVGRFGNFINNELYGYPSTLPWAVKIPYEKRAKGYEEYESFHPAFLYESLLSLLSFAMIYFLSKKIQIRRGFITAIYMINYGIIRLIVNRFRIDKEVFGFIETSDLFSLLFIIAGALLMLYLKSQKKTY